MPFKVAYDPRRPKGNRRILLAGIKNAGRDENGRPIPRRKHMEDPDQPDRLDRSISRMLREQRRLLEGKTVKDSSIPEVFDGLSLRASPMLPEGTFRSGGKRGKDVSPSRRNKPKV